MAYPAGPASPALVQTLKWLRQPFRFMERCYRKYGEAFTVALGPLRLVFVCSPEAMRTLLTTDNGESFDAPGELNSLFEPFLGTQSLTAISGPEHRRMRQLMMPPFHGDRMRAYSQTILDVTRAVMAEVPGDRPWEVRKGMQAISMRVILRAVFGLSEDGEKGGRYRQVETLLTSLLDQISSPLSTSLLYFPILRLDLGPWTPWGRFVRERQQLDDLLYAEIDERRTCGDADRTDILSLLMAAEDEAGEKLTPKELRDELMTLLLAGHETTATAMTWALYWVHRHPEVLEKLRQEWATLSDPQDVMAVLKLPYLNAVCNETLRINPVGMLTFPRRTSRAVSLGGVTLDPGTVVVGSIYLAHRREATYPQADRFNPDRFLERQYSPYEFLPFGGGARRCIGMAFAQMEMKLAVSRILNDWDFDLTDNRPVYPVRRGLTAASSPVYLTVKGKRTQTADASVVALP